MNFTIKNPAAHSPCQALIGQMWAIAQAGGGELPAKALLELFGSSLPEEEQAKLDTYGPIEITKQPASGFYFKAIGLPLSFDVGEATMSIPGVLGGSASIEAMGFTLVFNGGQAPTGVDHHHTFFGKIEVPFAVKEMSVGLAEIEIESTIATMHILTT